MTPRQPTVRVCKLDSGPATARAVRRLHWAIISLAAVLISVRVRGAPPATSWPFVPPKDTYRADALLDLRALNEKVAGETGFVRLSPDGNSFVRGDGAALRFWSVVSDGASMKPEEMAAHCDFLAKRGVNMVRLHLTLCDTRDGASISALNEPLLDSLFRFVSIAKTRGIYVTLSPYWAALKPPASWNLADYSGQQPWGLLFFNPDLQAAYRIWLREIYTRLNPYTQIALKDDPAVAIAQLQNEDSLLFWTQQGIHGQQKAILDQRFTSWATHKYGSLGQTRTAWAEIAEKGDTANLLSVGAIWALTQEPPNNPGRRQRLADETEFLAALQRTFNAETQSYLRSLGVKALVNAENWRTADPVRLNDAERWSYAANEVLAVNAYVGGLHVGPNNGYRVDPGHKYTDLSILTHPERFPLNIKQTVGHPMLVTECAWTNPNLYQSEGPFLAAAYGSLTGIGSVYWFAANTPTWLADPRRMFWPVGTSYAVDKWSISTPMGVAQFPAMALAFRRGDVKLGAPAVHEERTLADLWTRKVPVISEEGRFDPNRDPGAFSPTSAVKQEVDRLAYFIGPVEAIYEGDPRKTTATGITPFLNREAKTIRSNTDELYLDYAHGLCIVSAPKFQGVCGFLKSAGGGFQTADLQITSPTEYATIAVVSMDDAPIATSRKVLIQIGTTARLTGYDAKPARFRTDETSPEIDGQEITNTGQPPWRIATIDATIRIHNKALTHATLLDLNGNAFDDEPVTRDGEWFVVKLPPSAMYIVLR